MIPAIIPFYRNRSQLDRCVSRLSAQTCQVELFIRDNSEDNILYTAAVNEGILRFLDAPCEFMLVINQDMYLEPDAVATLVAFMRSHPSCGIAAPLQLDPARPNYVVFGGTLEAFPFGRHVHGPLENFREPRQVHWINGACMLLRRQMIREIGILDPNLRFIGSDSDYSFTARSRGWELWVIPEARGVHEQGASRATLDPKIETQKLSDMIHFCRKWLNGELYRSLAFEGSALDAKSVSRIYQKMMALENRGPQLLHELD